MFDGVQVRVYTPRGLSVTPSPALINIHGGGWAYLDIGNGHLCISNCLKITCKDYENIKKTKE